MGMLVGSFIQNTRTTEKVTTENIGKILADYIQGNHFNSEEEQSAYEKKLNEKIQTGKKLTGEELSYIRKNMPEMYAKVLRAQNKRKMVEEQCKNAKSKEEVEEINQNAMSLISDKDPDKEMLMNVVKDAVNEFKKSDDYKRLPAKDEEDKYNPQKGEKEKMEYFATSGNYQEIYQSEATSSFSVKI